MLIWFEKIKIIRMKSLTSEFEVSGRLQIKSRFRFLHFFFCCLEILWQFQKIGLLRLYKITLQEINLIKKIHAEGSQKITFKKHHSGFPRIISHEIKRKKTKILSSNFSSLFVPSFICFTTMQQEKVKLIYHHLCIHGFKKMNDDIWKVSDDKNKWNGHGMKQKDGNLRI